SRSRGRYSLEECMSESAILVLEGRMGAPVGGTLRYAPKDVVRGLSGSHRCRKAGRKRQIEMAMPLGDHARHMRSRGPRPDQYAEAMDLGENLCSRLKPRAREAFERCIVNGEQLKDAGRAMGVGESQVCNLIRQVRDEYRALTQYMEA